MKKERKYDLIFIIIAAGTLTIIQETDYSSILETYSLVFLVISYFIGKGVGKGVKEREWKEKSENEDK
ncbi:MAG: hypothetical protein ACQESJ_06205 [Bacteroidota bacterium]